MDPELSESVATAGSRVALGGLMRFLRFHQTEVIMGQIQTDAQAQRLGKPLNPSSRETIILISMAQRAPRRYGGRHFH